jgi:DNA repair protein RecN (Recombination protein N)
MLLNLHIKNLALIEELEVDFSEGLNIMSGETGAGKSIIIGSIELALGGKVDKGFLREGTEESLVELLFSVSDNQAKEIENLGIPVEDGEVILSRRITGGRAVNKINGETHPASKLREVATHLIDIHGQHEHQSLLQKKKQLEILDKFAGDALYGPKTDLKESYQEYCRLKKELEESNSDSEERARELSFLTFEVEEIEEAALIPGEDEELEDAYKKLTHGRKIVDAVSEVSGLCGYESYDSAGESVGKAFRTLCGVSVYDENLNGLCDQLGTIDSLLNDFARDLADYMDSFDFSEERLSQIEERLNLINKLKMKHGKTIEKILEVKAEKEERIEKLQNFDLYLEKLQSELAKAESQTEKLCAKISDIRKEAAAELSKKITEHLAELNFLDVRFEIQLEKLEHYSANGYDETEYLIAVNVGESLKPLAKVASGGELSRVMLALKTVLADKDEVESIIFDEIDTGISGRTAQKVSEKMALIGKNRQVICITHLPQIASMADTHFLIEKEVQGQMTTTAIRRLKESEQVTELARMLGGVEITEKVLENAQEMKQQAKTLKARNCQ